MWFIVLYGNYIKETVLISKSNINIGLVDKSCFPAYRKCVKFFLDILVCFLVIGYCLETLVCVWWGGGGDIMKCGQGKMLLPVFNNINK